jgi:hypothetical protein
LVWNSYSWTGGNVELTVRDVDPSTAVEELGGDVPVGVGGVLRMNNNGLRATSCRWVTGRTDSSSDSGCCNPRCLKEVGC